MKYKEYIVISFKDIDYIATKETNIKTIKEWYEKEYQDTLDLDEIKILTDKEKTKEFIFISDDAKTPRKTNCNKLINEMIKIYGEYNYIYLYGTEW